MIIKFEPFDDQIISRLTVKIFKPTACGINIRVTVKLPLFKCIKLNVLILIYIQFVKSTIYAETDKISLFLLIGLYVSFNKSSTYNLIMPTLMKG